MCVYIYMYIYNIYMYMLTFYRNNALLHNDTNNMYI